jgi:hypothetical protein
MREKWFGMCVGVLQDASKDPEADFSVVKSQLRGNGDAALRAFQVLSLLNYMAQKRYVPPEKGHIFADTLCALVFQDMEDECFDYFDRYSSRIEDVTTLGFSFNSDIAKYVTQSEDVLLPALALAPFTEFFVLQSHLVLADCFNDKKEAKAKMNALSNYAS